MAEDPTPFRGDSESKDPNRTKGDAQAVRRFAIDSARTLADERCEDVVVLDVRGLSQVSDYLVIGSGSSQRQMRSAVEHVSDQADAASVSVYRKSSDDESLWVLCDFVDVVVHVFEPNTRAHYDLEMMWGDAPRVDWRRAQDFGTPADYGPSAADGESD